MSKNNVALAVEDKSGMERMHWNTSRREAPHPPFASTRHDRSDTEMSDRNVNQNMMATTNRNSSVREVQLTPRQQEKMRRLLEKRARDRAERQSAAAPLTLILQTQRSESEGERVQCTPQDEERLLQMLRKKAGATRPPRRERDTTVAMRGADSKSESLLDLVRDHCSSEEQEHLLRLLQKRAESTRTSHSSSNRQTLVSSETQSRNRSESALGGLTMDEEEEPYPRAVSHEDQYDLTDISFRAFPSSIPSVAYGPPVQSGEQTVGEPPNGTPFYPPPPPYSYGTPFHAPPPDGSPYDPPFYTVGPPYNPPFYPSPTVGSPCGAPPDPQAAVWPPYCAPLRQSGPPVYAVQHWDPRPPNGGDSHGKTPLPSSFPQAHTQSSTKPSVRRNPIPKSAAEVSFGLWDPPQDNVIQPHPIASTNVGEHDVLCGRGSRVNIHSGNCRFRELVQEFKFVYSQAKRKKDKQNLTRSIVLIVRERGGRFLEEVQDGKLFEIGDAMAEKKAKQAIRDCCNEKLDPVAKRQKRNGVLHQPKKPIASYDAAPTVHPFRLPRCAVEHWHPGMPNAHSHGKAPLPPSPHSRTQHSVAKTQSAGIPKSATEVPFDLRDPPQEPITQPHPITSNVLCENDVLSGQVKCHIGNHRFQELVKEFKFIYSQAILNAEKNNLARSVVLIIRRRGGRFLREEDGKLFEIGDATAEKKAQQAIRDSRDRDPAAKQQKMNGVAHRPQQLIAIPGMQQDVAPMLPNYDPRGKTPILLSPPRQKNSAAKSFTSVVTRGTMISLPSASCEVGFSVTNPPKEPVLLPYPTYSTQLNENDVLCEYGEKFDSFGGNRSFKHLVHDFQKIYSEVEGQVQKSLARSIVLIIRKRRGRFLTMEETGEVSEIGDVMAAAVTEQALMGESFYIKPWQATNNLNQVESEKVAFPEPQSDVGVSSNQMPQRRKGIPALRKADVSSSTASHTDISMAVDQSQQALLEPSLDDRKLAAWAVQQMKKRVSHHREEHAQKYWLPAYAYKESC